MLGWRREARRFRLRDHALESVLPGADLLLDAWALVDLSVDEALAASRKAGSVLACGPGCAACCSQPIPLTPLEALGIEAWLRIHSPACGPAIPAQPPAVTRPCPFLDEGVCQVYAARPLACRRYLVLQRACAPGEDPTRTRPGHLLVPDPALLEAALMRTLPWYRDWPQYPAKVTRNTARTFFHAVTTLIQAIPWGKELAQKDGKA